MSYITQLRLENYPKKYRQYTEYSGTEDIYDYDNVDVDLIEVESVAKSTDNENGIANSVDVDLIEVESVGKSSESDNSLMEGLSPVQRQQVQEQQELILEQLQQNDQPEFDEFDSNDSNDTSSTHSSSLSFVSQVEDANHRKSTLSHKPSVSFGKLMTFGSLRGKLNRPRVSKHVRMLSELKIPVPETNEPILFESGVQKWVSSTSKKSSNNYLVLTTQCLCSFKSSQKAAKILNDNLPTANGSNDDNSSDSLTSDVTARILPPENVVFSLATVYAVSSVSDHPTSPHIRVDYISGPKNHDYVSISSQDHQRWLTVLRAAIHSANSVGPYLMLSQRKRIMEKLGALEDLADEDEDNLFAFRVLLRTVINQDSVKELNVPVFFVFGRNNIYLIPLNFAGNDLSPNDDGRELKRKQSLHYPLLLDNAKPKEIELRKFQYPLLCLTSIYSDGHDDTFQLTFRNSTGTMERSLRIASILTENIITEIRTAIDSITFWWPSPGYELKAPANMQATIIPPERESDKTSHAIGFDRMIEAQCHANRVERSRISFNIEYVLGSENIVLGLGVDNLPFRFILLPPGLESSQSEQDDTYSNQELIAIFSSLKYHPLLHEIILRDTNLFELQIQPGPKDHKGTNMLGAVLYDILLSNPRLNKLDLTACGITSETVSAIGAAFMTGQSCLECLLLGENSITREGVEALASGITGHKSAIKELDLSNCKLTQESFESILHALDANDPDKLEVLNISNNACDLESSILSELLSKAVSLRTLNLSHCPKLFARTTSVISLEILGNTQLTTLNFGGIPLNNHEHIDDLYVYIQSPAFAKVRFLNIDHCNLDGEMIAIILSYITTSPNCKKIRVWAGGNHLTRTSHGYKEFCNAIRNNWTPTWLSLEDTIFGSDSGIITDILQSFCENTVIEYLDLSYPNFDSGKEAPFNPLTSKVASKACEIIGRIFINNQSIKEIELCGSSGRRFGPALGASLFELEKNDVLEKLNVKGNAIGNQGAKALSGALRSNTKLKALNCDDNDIGTEGYSAIHHVFTNGLNKTLKQFVYPTQDLETHDETLDAKLTAISRESIFNPRLSQKIASEKQKIHFRKIIDEIVKSVESIENFTNFDDDSLRSAPTSLQEN